MASSPTVPRLITGMRMQRDEFLRVWEQIPDLKNAELIDGVVYVASPVSVTHGAWDTIVQGWLFTYLSSTPGIEHLANATWLMLSSAPQPDASVYVPAEYGGRVTVQGNLAAGAPELAIEVCLTSRSKDFGPKLALYQRAGVREYVTFEVSPQRITWRILVDGSYRKIRPAGGILRSVAFPGLWLNVAAFWQRDRASLIATLQQGINDAAHRTFVRELNSRKRAT